MMHVWTTWTRERPDELLVIHAFEGSPFSMLTLFTQYRTAFPIAAAIAVSACSNVGERIKALRRGARVSAPNASASAGTRMIRIPVPVLVPGAAPVQATSGEALGQGQGEARRDASGADAAASEAALEGKGAKDAAELASWDPDAKKVVLTWVANPFPSGEAAEQSTQAPTRVVELAVRAGATLKRIRLAPSLGVMHPEGVSLCSPRKPDGRWWVRFDHGVAERYVATRPRPGLLRIQSSYLTDGNCGGTPCPEQVLQQAEVEIPPLVIEERIRVVQGPGKERDFSCQSGEFAPEG